MRGQNLATADPDQLGAIRGLRTFQGLMTALNPLHTIGRQINEALRIYTGMTRLVRSVRVIELLDSVHLAEPAGLLRTFAHQLSNGQRQHIGIARAFAVAPDLGAAEPVSALDLSVRAQVLALLANIKVRLDPSMVCVTHDLCVALQVCDRIAVMPQRQVVEVAPTTEIFANPKHAHAKVLFAAVPGANRQDRRDP